MLATIDAARIVGITNWFIRDKLEIGGVPVGQSPDRDHHRFTSPSALLVGLLSPREIVNPGKPGVCINSLPVHVITFNVNESILVKLFHLRFGTDVVRQ